MSNLKIIGVSGKPKEVGQLEETIIRRGDRTARGSLLFIPEAGINLLGRDLMVELGFQLLDLDSGTPMYPLQIEDEEQIDPTVWADGKMVGRLGIVPIKVTVKPGITQSWTPQYPMTRKGRIGLQPVVNELIKQGLLEPTMSPFNSPILAVQKKDGKYRMVEDLRNINRIVVPRFPVVPDPYTLLSRIPPTTRWYTVIDLKDAFWTCPLDTESRDLFAFEWEDVNTGRKQQYRWTVLPQGYTESPLLFGQALGEKLAGFTTTGPNRLLQYVDDLLMMGEKEKEVRQDSIRLLNWLGKLGVKVSKDKLQFVQRKVKYLGHLLEGGTRKLDPERVKGILELQPPRNKTDVRRMLGLLGYCRLWIDQFAKLVRFLNRKLAGDGRITWEQDDEQRWEEVKKTLIGAPVLALPNLQQPFHLYVTISSQTAVGVLAQKRGGRYQPVAYLSKTLEPVVRAWPTCIQVVAAAAELVVESRKLTFGGALIVHSPHQISTILTGAASTWMTDGRLTHYETVLRTSPDITLGTDRNLNPAEFLIGERKEWEPDEHDCLGTIQLMAKVREDLSEIPLVMGERWYVDGSSYVEEGKRKSGYAVVKEDGEIIESGALPANWSAQKCEIMALTRALELAGGLEVTVWTDSRYAWGVVHTFGRTWRDRGFIKADGKQIEHMALLERLLDALIGPEKVAVVHIPAHTRGTTPEESGNRWADLRAKEAAKGVPNEITIQQCALRVPILTAADTENLTFTSPEMEYITREGWEKRDEEWRTPEGQIVLPKTVMMGILEKIHESGHFGTEAMVNVVKSLYWSKDMWPMAHSIAWKCIICQKVNRTRAKKTEKGGRPLAVWPFQRIQVDFTELPEKGGYKHLLVVKDHLTGWVEAFPSRKATAQVTIKAILEHIVPRFGIIEAIDSDRGTHFTQKVLQEVMAALGIKWDLHTPWHPESSGKVERANAEIKKHLTKLYLENGLPWTKNLPLALLRMRIAPRKDLGVSPFELMMGRPYLAQLGQPMIEFKDLFIRKYLRSLSQSLLSLHRRGVLVQRPPLLEQQHSFQPGDLVLIKTWKAEKLSPGWDGPFRVLLVTESAIRTREYGWTHYHRVKRAPPERWTAIPSLDDPLKIKITKSGTGNQERTVRQ
uniref:Gag-Pol polyprotein n=1 Tax=Podarcis muralis TaxID=64176 RepID=A0A670HPN7_PODMU